MTQIRQFKKHLDIFLILFFLFLVILFLILKSPGFRGSILEEYLVIFDKKVFPHQYKGKVTTVQSLLKDILNFKSINLNKENIENLIIDIDFEDYNQILSDREKSLKLNRNEQYLISRNEVNAKIRLKDKKFLASIRLKGDRADHWKNNKRFSLMIKLKNSEAIDSFQKFAITGHAKRAFPQNEAISKTLAEIGVIVPEFRTYRVNFNGHNWGQMYAEEQFSSSFYEKKKLKESPIVKFTNSEDGKIPAILALKDYQRGFLKEIFNQQGVYEINPYLEKKFKKDKVNLERLHLLQHFNYFLNKKNLSADEIKKITDLINLEKFAIVFAISSLFHDGHAIDKENIRFYLNPFNVKIEPIPTDFGGQNFYNDYGRYNDFQEFEEFTQNSPKYFSILYENKDFQKYYFEYLKYIIKNLQIVKNNLNETCKNEDNNCNSAINFKNLKINYNLILNNSDQLFKKTSNRESINKKDIERIQKKIEEYGSKKILDNLNNFVFSRFYKDGEIFIDNLVYFPIEIKELRINNESDNNCKIIIPYNKVLDSVKSIKFQIRDEKLLNCLKNTSKYELDLMINNQLKTQVFDLYPSKFKDYFSKNEHVNLDLADISNEITDDNILIKPGKYHIKKPIIISKKNLTVSPGTILFFDKNTFIKIVDGNLIINGTEDNKVQLQGYKDTWNGIHVINSKKSKIYHSIIQDLDYFSDNLFTNLTGGINFYNSNLIVDGLTISNVTAEDAINLTHSKVNLNRLKIFNTLSDGADLDFCNGSINEFTSSNIKGDGLDFSGSKIKITNGNLSNTIDKAISIGEKSDIQISETFIKNADIGIAVKDDSVAKLENNLFIQNNKDISIYMKKSYYHKGGTLYISREQKKKLKINLDNLSTINTVN